LSRKLRQKRRRAIRGRAGRTPTWAIALGPAVVLHGVRCVVRAEGFEVTAGSRVQEFEWYFHLACQCARHRGTTGHRGVPHVLAESVAVKQAGCGRGGLPSVLWRDRGTNGPITRPCSRRLGPPLRSGPPAAEGHGVIRTVPRHPRGTLLSCVPSIRTPFSREPGTHRRCPPQQARGAVVDAHELDESEHGASLWALGVHVHELPASAGLLVALDVLRRDLARWFQGLSSRTPCHCISGSHDVTDRSPETAGGARE